MGSKEKNFAKYLIELSTKHSYDVDFDVIDNQRILTFYSIGDSSSINVDNIFLNNLNCNDISFIRFTGVICDKFTYHKVDSNGVNLIDVHTEQEFKKYIRIEKLKEIIF